MSINNKHLIAVVAAAGLLVWASGEGGAQALHPQEIPEDSVVIKNTLSEITVSAFELNKKLSDQPAPVFYLGAPDLDRFGRTDILAAVNTIPGVNMQQRSPQSYRLDIRGSALRSPFGVRNVKVYYNGIPLTDPGGNTYLNELGFEDIYDLTVIKGPAGSLYGAGTGGVVLINSPLLSNDSSLKNKAQMDVQAGSYGLRKAAADVRWGGNALRYADTRSDGYREQTGMHSKVAAFESVLKSTSRQQLALTAHYTDLYYEIPGGLTAAEFDRDPKAARPAAGIYPSAEENQTAVRQKNFLLGIREQYHFDERLRASAVLYGAYTDFINPTIRNYEFRKEPHFGGRLVFQRRQQLGNAEFTVSLGGEAQQGFFNVTDQENDKGRPGAMMNDNNIDMGTALAFVQGDLMMPHGWELSLAASYHSSGVSFKQLYPSPVKAFHTVNDHAFSPRVALSRKLSGGQILYLNASSGFSPPTVSELLPSTSVINTSLRPENGISYDLGSRGFLFNRKLYYDVGGFIFNLKNSISLRRDSSGADYFVNAGGTIQHGAEAYLAYSLMNRHHILMKAWTSASWFDFSYKDYAVADKNYTGKKLPGVAPFSFSAGLDLQVSHFLSGHLTYTERSAIPLDDANEVHSLPWHLLDLNVSYNYNLSHKMKLTIFGGINNLLNQTYSLGDDVNAAGGRYFNIAPGINFYVGITLLYFM